MVIVNNYGLAIFFYVVCCVCWGSWANTQKMVTTKSWRFELFYWDLSWGLFLTALIAALTLGSMGNVGRTFFQDLSQANLSSVGYALLGGIVWNTGNILFSAAIAIAGMSVGFPIGGGIGWIGGILFNYLLILLSGQVYSGNQALLFVGVACIVVAIVFCAMAYNKLSSGQGGKSPAKGIILAVIAGIGFMFFYGLVVKSLDPEFVSGGTGNLTPFSGVFFFATGILVSTPILNSIAMRNPVDGEKVTFKDYLKGDSRTHMIGLLGGLIWMTGMVVSFMSAGVANPAISYALSNASPIVAMIWGIFIWKEFKGAPKGTNGLLTTMFLLFLLGLVVITMSNS